MGEKVKIPMENEKEEGVKFQKFFKVGNFFLLLIAGMHFAGNFLSTFSCKHIIENITMGHNNDNVL